MLSSESWAPIQEGTRPGQTLSDLPEFDDPPVVEVAVGVQFRPLFGLRGLALAPLRDRWRHQYPNTEEQPALSSAVEGSPTLVPHVGDLPSEYPRYGHMRETFVNRFNDLAQFVTGGNLGELEIIQAELTYINVIEADRDELGRIDRFLKGWSGADEHHLGEPEQARVTLTFLIPGIGVPPVRLYAEVNPAQKPSGEPVLFFTLTARGNPGGKSLAEALKFIDEAHDHLTRSFAELTEESMHDVWGRRA